MAYVKQGLPPVCLAPPFNDLPISGLRATRRWPDDRRDTRG